MRNNREYIKFCKNYTCLIFFMIVFISLIFYTYSNKKNIVWNIESSNTMTTAVMSKTTCPMHLYLEHGSCVRKRLYTVPCLHSDQCDNLRYLICPRTVGGCNCPFYSSGYFCDCNSTMYWNSTTHMCDTRRVYGEKCDLGEEYQCQTSQGLTCKDKICTCANKEFAWTGSTCAKCPKTWSCMIFYII